MPTYSEVLIVKQVADLAAYLNSLKPENTKGPPLNKALARGLVARYSGMIIFSGSRFLTARNPRISF
jgi:hypothetical protein